MFFFKSPKSDAMSPADAISGARDGSVVVIDVREHGEVAKTGKAKGALHMPLMRLPHMADPSHPDYNDVLKSKARIALYCASGGRSSAAAKTLRRLGYRDVHNIGGLNHWVQAGGEIEAV